MANYRPLPAGRSRCPEGNGHQPLLPNRSLITTPGELGSAAWHSRHCGYQKRLILSHAQLAPIPRVRESLYGGRVRRNGRHECILGWTAAVRMPAAWNGIALARPLSTEYR